jgi:hypothetical protein
MSEEKHERPFENITSEEDQEESKRPKKRRRPFEDHIEHQLIKISVPDKFSLGNVFDAEIFEPEPAKMIVKRLKDEGYDIGD